MVYVTSPRALEQVWLPLSAQYPPDTITGKHIIPSSYRRSRMLKISSEAYEKACELTNGGSLGERDGIMTSFEWVSSPQSMRHNAEPASLLDLALEGALPCAIVRKKSGETVRPALRKARSEGRALSMSAASEPSRRVHFGPCIEDVRYFFRLDMPSSVSSECSPACSDGESDDEEVATGSSPSSFPSNAPLPWKLQLPNFPRTICDPRPVPVRLERLTLTDDRSTLIGVVNVLNYSFHKTVVARFTFDFWTTVSEVTAEYSHGLPNRKAPYGNDKFKFRINLSDLTNLENRTMYLCIRYAVDGREYWDNNASHNYEARFIKEDPTKWGSSESSNAEPSQKSLLLSPRWPMLAFDDFSLTYGHYNRIDTRYNRDGTDDNEQSHCPPNQQQYNPVRSLSHRYDLGASLTAALFAKSDTSTPFDDTEELPTAIHSGRKKLVATNAATNMDYMKNNIPLLSH